MLACHVLTLNVVVCRSSALVDARVESGGVGTATPAGTEPPWEGGDAGGGMGTC